MVHRQTKQRHTHGLSVAALPLTPVELPVYPDTPSVLFIVSAVAMAAEMTCTCADDNGCTMAKGGDTRDDRQKPDRSGSLADSGRIFALGTPG